MTTFEVTITETRNHVYIVEADDQNDAQEDALARYEKGEDGNDGVNDYYVSDIEETT